MIKGGGAWAENLRWVLFFPGGAVIFFIHFARASAQIINGLTLSVLLYPYSTTDLQCYQYSVISFAVQRYKKKFSTIFSNFAHSITIGAMNTGVTVQDAAVKSISLKTDFQLPNKLDIFVGKLIV